MSEKYSKILEVDKNVRKFYFKPNKNMSEMTWPRTKMSEKKRRLWNVRFFWKMSEIWITFYTWNGDFGELFISVLLQHGNFLTSSRDFLAFFHPRNKKSRILKKFRHFYKWINLLTFSYPSIFQCVHYCGPIRIVRIFLMAGECVYLWQSRKEKNIELNDGIAQYGICSTTRETIQEFRIGAKMGCSKT